MWQNDVNRRTAITVLLAGVSLAQEQKPIPFVCPMDPDVRSGKPARCPRCGMQLVAGIPDPAEYLVDLKLEPRAVKPGIPVRMTFRVLSPDGRKLVNKFDLIHERLFHLFVISQDLRFFIHDHPELQPDGSFAITLTLPFGGGYRVLCDFYPSGGTPQMIAKTVLLPGAGGKPDLRANTAEKSGENLRVNLKTEPSKPLAGQKTMLFFHLEPADGLEPYLGAWGHMLAASGDLIDLMHAHPAWEEGGPRIQFNVIFPRPGLHRIWVQFQRLSVVNTVAFDLQVGAL
jgi:Heavy metal binding domain